MSGMVITFRPMALQQAAPPRRAPSMTAQRVVLEILLGAAASFLAGGAGFLLGIHQTGVAITFGITALLIVVYVVATMTIEDAIDAASSTGRE
jgi:drug/metabolite transporter (DMT)-like permease